MDEVLPGVFHWTAVHPQIGVPVSSYWLEPDGVTGYEPGDAPKLRTIRAG